MPYISAQYRAIVMLHRNSQLVNSYATSGLPAFAMKPIIVTEISETIRNVPSVLMKVRQKLDSSLVIRHVNSKS